MSTERRLEEIQRLLSNLSEDASKGTPVIVEGPNDVASLKNLGVEAYFVCAKTAGKSNIDLIDEIIKLEKKETILLLDFDKRGKKLTNQLLKGFRFIRIKPNLVYWKRFQNLVGRDVKDIEGLSTFIFTLARKVGKTL